MRYFWLTVLGVTALCTAFTGTSWLHGCLSCFGGSCLGIVAFKADSK